MGGGSSLQGLYVSDKLAMTPAGGFWAGGLINAGMEKGTFDVQFWPQWKSQRHQLGVGGNWIFTGSPNPDAMFEPDQVLRQAGADAQHLRIATAP